MKTNPITSLLAPCALALFVVTCPPVLSAPVGTAFTYQGRLTEQGQPANGIYDFRFVIRDAPAGGNQLRGAETKLAVPVRDGVFSLAIDFGSSVFDGDLRWLDIEARTNGAATFAALTPLQPLRPAPYAIAAHALNGTLPASQLTGSLGSTALAGSYENPVSFTSPSNHFTGDGSGLKFGGFSYTNLPFYWNVKGNAGTTPGRNFVGTLDAQPLELRVNNQRAFRLEPASVSPNLIGGFGGNYADAGVIGSTISGGGTIEAPNRIIKDSSHQEPQPPEFATIGGGSGNTISGASHVTIGGGAGNLVRQDMWVIPTSPQFYSVIAGGASNYLTGSMSTISGGVFNSMKGDLGQDVMGGTIGGGVGNSVSTITDNARYPTISGGDHNTISQANFASIGGGTQNLIDHDSTHATIGGGGLNRIGLGTAENATIAGGFSNNIKHQADGATVGGGVGNVIQHLARYAIIGGGLANGISEEATGAVISGGEANRIWNFADHATIGGGWGNLIGSNAVDYGGGLQVVQNATIGGGLGNVIYRGADQATIGGGAGNLINVFARGAVIAGGRQNTLSEWCTDSVISGGISNYMGFYAIGASIGGGAFNRFGVDTFYPTISGGSGNTVEGRSYTGTIGGGTGNTVGGFSVGGTIGGGTSNRIEYYTKMATISGGEGNGILFGQSDSSQAGYGTIAGGLGNIIGYGANAAVISGGESNQANGPYSTVAGGRLNIASGVYSTAMGLGARAIGDISTAMGWYTYAGGQGATALGSSCSAGGMGSTAMGDGATTTGNFSTAMGHSTHAGGNSSTAMGRETAAIGHMSTAMGFKSTASGYVSSAMGYRAQATNDGTFVWADSEDADFTSTGTNQFLIRASGGVGIGTDSPQFALHVNGEAGKPGGGAWSVASDARLKKDIRPLEQALARLLQLHGVTYEYKDPKAIHELPGQQTGMIAQEVEKVFPDWVEKAPDGMRRLSIRGFEALTVEALRDLRAEKDEQIRARDAQIAAMEKRLAALEERVAK